ncbi:pyrroloquinoline quinone precursor peptide PqqA [Xanthomonas fragariae]|uniref:pyrroloquinoline quinone precursor peptide PqqA n=1 Tax=Xanthomonas fragariae TaxID=48664 RepID=UPI0022AA1AEA|nr:pyrroloquinoline quinone precursor peptide PqqA [Xanthomonas fragariae]WAT14170.1 pyrroloquinoline quinone precursor peptide PqqA [Xanthomonas fragariae]
MATVTCASPSPQRAISAQARSINAAALMHGSPANALIRNRSASVTPLRRMQNATRLQLFTFSLQLAQTGYLFSSDVIAATCCGDAIPTNREITMKTWKKPVVREINCGAEINCYVSGEF